MRWHREAAAVGARPPPSRRGCRRASCRSHSAGVDGAIWAALQTHVIPGGYRRVDRNPEIQMVASITKRFFFGLKRHDGSHYIYEKFA